MVALEFSSSEPTFSLGHSQAFGKDWIEFEYSSLQYFHFGEELYTGFHKKRNEMCTNMGVNFVIQRAIQVWKVNEGLKRGGF